MNPMDATALYEVMYSICVHAIIALKMELHQYRKQHTVKSCCRALNYLFLIFAKQDMSVTEDMGMVLFPKLSGRQPATHLSVLGNDAFQCSRVEDDYRFERFFIERLFESICGRSSSGLTRKEWRL